MEESSRVFTDSEHMLRIECGPTFGSTLVKLNGRPLRGVQEFSLNAKTLTGYIKIALGILSTQEDRDAIQTLLTIPWLTVAVQDYSNYKGSNERRDA